MTIGLLVAWMFLALTEGRWIGADTKAIALTGVADVGAMDGTDQQPPPPKP